MTEAVSGLPEAARSQPFDSFDRVFEPSSGLRAMLRLREVWAYRELLVFLTWRDVKVRYRQTAIGALWAVIQPFMLMVVFTIFLGRLAHVPSNGLPYPIFAYAALVPWTLFSSSLSSVSDSLVSSSNLISKVYFPRLVIPLAAVGSFVFDFVIALGLLVAMMVYYGIYPGWPILALPALTLLTLLTALSVGMWLTALNVRYRDVKYAIPFLIQIWLFASPIAYATSLVPSRWRLVYSLNPMVGVIDGFRWALLGVAWQPGSFFVVSLAMIAALLVSGLVYFRKMERTFADIV
ncbi:MAG: ABC transporter permease [Candidatus Limnocylindrales bacterium]